MTFEKINSKKQSWPVIAIWSVHYPILALQAAVVCGPLGVLELHVRVHTMWINFSFYVNHVIRSWQHLLIVTESPSVTLLLHIYSQVAFEFTLCRDCQYCRCSTGTSSTVRSICFVPIWIWLTAWIHVSFQGVFCNCLKKGRFWNCLECEALNSRWSGRVEKQNKKKKHLYLSLI